MLGPGEVTVKSTPLLGTPETVTTMLPLWLVPKFVPVMVTEVAMGPEVGLRLVMLGVGITVKVTPLLSTPPTVTTTGPVVAPAGTVTMMLVALQFEIVVTGVPL